MEVFELKKILEFIKYIPIMIVSPRRILEQFRVKNLDQGYNKVLGNDLVVKVLALVIAFVLVVAARYSPGTAQPALHQETLENIPVTILYDEDYTHSGPTIPTHVDVILSGDITQIRILEAGGGITAHIDLRDLEPGIYPNVLIQVEGVTEPTTWTASPSTAGEIEIVRNETMELEIEPSPFNAPEIENRYIMEISVIPEVVTVRGPQRFLDEIVALRATFDASSIDDGSGERELFFQGFVSAQDNVGNSVAGVKFDPQEVQVRVEIIENLRTITIEVNEQLLFNVPSDYTIESVTVDIDEIEVWGDFAEMDSTLVLPNINFENLDNNGRITIPISPRLPPGVESDTTEVEVTVIYESSEDEDDDDENEDS